MILQAGFDLTQLAQPLIRRHGRNKNRLVLIQATRDLELIGVGILTKHFSGKLSPHMDAILEHLEPDYTKFFAIAHPSQGGPFGIPDPDIAEESELLSVRASTQGCQLIGHVLFEEDRWQSLGGNHYFDQYFHDITGLPTTMDHWSRTMDAGGDP